MLLIQELLDAADIRMLRSQQDGTFTVTACPKPTAYLLELPRRIQCSSTVTVKVDWQKAEAHPRNS